MESSCAKVPEKVELDIAEEWRICLMDINNIEMLWSQAQVTFKMCFIMAQHGGNAFDLGSYFAKRYIHNSMITTTTTKTKTKTKNKQTKKTNPLCWLLAWEHNLGVMLANQSSQHDVRNHASSLQEVIVNGNSHQDYYTKWNPCNLTSCVIKKNWWKLDLFLQTMCLPPTQLSASLQ